MKNKTNPWHEKRIRSIYDPSVSGYWFSVVDLFAVLTGSNHKTARGYWKQLKYKLSPANPQVVTVSHHLKLESPNGKYHFTEAVDFKNLIYLIQICPSPKANPYRLWLADMLFDSVPVEELEEELAKLGAESARQVVEKYKNKPDEPYVRVTIHKREIPL